MKGSLVTVVEGIEDGLDRLKEYEVSPLESEYEPKPLNGLLPTSLSSPEESEMEESDSESEMHKLDMLDDDDINDEPQNSQLNDEQKNSENDTFRGRPSSCVFVASLAASLSDDELSLSVTKHFQQWGDLTLVKVLRDPSNRPYAFVQYSNDRDAKFAMKQAQHTVLNGRTIRCEAAKVNRTLYISTCNGNEVSLKLIRDTLGSYGEIEQLVGNNDTTYRKSNLNKAWFVQFAYRDDAIRAYANLRLSPDWIIEWAQNIEHPSGILEKLDEIDKCSIFVGQLDSKVTKELLTERFSRHGKISEVTLVMKQGNNFAFIKFGSDRAAAAAVERENHAVFLEKTMHVQYREIHHKRKKCSSNIPTLNLAPPPVNLPVRRASTGSGYSPVSFTKAPMGHFASVEFHQSRSLAGRPIGSKHPGSRSVSFSEGRSGRFYPYDASDVIMGARPFGTPSKTEDGTKQCSVGNQTPLSSPSNHTLNSSSNGEAKSLFSTTSVTASDTHPSRSNNATMGTFGAYGSGKLQMRRTISHHELDSSAIPPPPPSSYYYYPYPSKENMYYDQQSLPVAYPSYTYYYPDSSIPPAPYYMYYGVPQTPNFPESKKPNHHGGEENRFRVLSPLSSKDEIDY